MLTYRFTGKQQMRIISCYVIFFGIIFYSHLNSRQGLYYLLICFVLGIISFALSFNKKMVKIIFPREVTRLTSFQKWERVIGLFLIIFAALDILFLKKLNFDYADLPLFYLGYLFFITM